MSYEVILTACPRAKRAAVMAVLMKHSRIGLRVATSIVDQPPATAISNVDSGTANAIQAELVSAGASAEAREL